MKRNLNKAFTLIELLAVIVILAIIALIATPIILGIVEDARKDSFERSVELLISTTDLDVAGKNIQEGYTYEIVDGTIPDLEIGIKNIDGMNGKIVYDKEGKEQYAIHNGKYCVMKTGDMSKAVISEYEEGSCKLVIATDSKYFTYKEIEIEPTYEIIDKEACQTFFVGDGAPSEEATTICNNEPYFDGMTLTEALANGFDPLDIKELLDAGAISYNGLTFEIVDKDACIDVHMNEWNYSEEEATAVCNNEPYYFGEMTLTESLAIGFIPQEVITQFIDAEAIRVTNAPLEITGYSEEGPKNVVIPSTIDGKTVVSIKTMAFANKSLTSIFVPDTIASVETYAFANNNLNEQNKNKLEQKYQFSTITPTDASCFTYEEVEGGISITGYKCANTDIAIPSTINNKNVVKIADWAFQSAGLKSLVIPDTVIYIDNDAFSDNQITTLFIPDSVTSIGKSAFHSNPLTSVIIKNNNIILTTGVFCKHNLSETSESYQKIYSINPDAFNCPPPQ